MCERCFAAEQYEKKHPIVGRALRWAGPVSFAVICGPILIPAGIVLLVVFGPIIGACLLVSWFVGKKTRPEPPEES